MSDTIATQSTKARFRDGKIDFIRAIEALQAQRGLSSREARAIVETWAEEVLQELRAMTNNRITPQPQYDALHEFDAENNVEPARTIAERIAYGYGCDRNHPLVDEIAHAIEDAIELGQRRGRLIPPRDATAST